MRIEMKLSSVSVARYYTRYVRLFGSEEFIVELIFNPRINDKTRLTQVHSSKCLAFYELLTI